MAYPPATLPINRTNAVPQQDTHPADHNAVNGAVNDITAELGANPSGTYPTLTARLDARPMGTPLVVKAADVTVDPSYMDGFLDLFLNINEYAPVYPFATVERLSISGLYIKPDRTFSVGAFIYATNFAEPGSSNARVYDSTPAIITSTGATWTRLPALNAAQRIPANGNIGWVLRLTGVTGGTTAFGYSYAYVIERFACNP